MKIKCVSDSGPIIHLKEVDSIQSFRLFSSVFIAPAVLSELEKRKETGELVNKLFELKKLKQKYKTESEFIYLKYKLGEGESESISLCKQEQITIFLTDDLEARIISKKFSLKPVGSIGIILRAYRRNIIPYEEAISKLKLLLKESSLFITPDIVNIAIDELTRYHKQKNK